MRNSLAALVGMLLLTSCASTPTVTETSLSYRQQLDVYKGMKIRLYRVSRPLKTNGAGICRPNKYDDGILTHDLFDYPERMRSVAQSYWGLTESPVQLHTSHIRGDACLGSLRLSYENQPSAHTNGESIFITPSLLDEVDDLSLALVIAHELGHIALGHVDMEPSKKLEREADRFALFMLTLAALDFRTAIALDAAHKRPHTQEKSTNTDTNKRAEHFRTVALEIEALQASGDDWYLNLRPQPKP